MQNKNCPQHGLMSSSPTKYGVLHFCEHLGCSVQCWDGETSTPANAKTRAARIGAHVVFDRLWKTGLMSRVGAYKWMAGITGLEQEKAHIGMFKESQCNLVIKRAEALLEKQSI